MLGAERRGGGTLRLVQLQDVEVREQLVELELRLYGASVTADSPEVTEAYELWKGALAEASGDPKRAWKTTLQAMLEDARLVYY